jgi:hypothetical protein
VVLSKKTAPILSGKAAPFGPAGVVCDARRAPTPQFSARSFSPGVVGRSGCGMKPRTLGVYRLASEFDGDSDRRLDHRRIGRSRLRCCPQQDVRWRSEAREMSRWRNRIRAWGSGEPATYHPGSWDVKRAACVLKGGLEFSAERSLESGRTRLRCCMAGCQQTTSCAGAKGCWNGNNGYFLEKGWRKVNHGVIEPAPGNGHVLRNGGSTLRWIVPSTTDADKREPVAKSTCRPRLARWIDGPASPSARQRPRGHRSGPKPRTSRSAGRHRLTTCRIGLKQPVNKGQEKTGACSFRENSLHPERPGPTALLPPKEGRRRERRQGRRLFWN